MARFVTTLQPCINIEAISNYIDWENELLAIELEQTGLLSLMEDLL
jgi:hypothetical protein